MPLHIMSHSSPIMAWTSTGPYPVRPAPKTKSRRLIDHVLEQLQLCTLNEIRDNSRELQTTMEACMAHLNKCIHACQDAAAPPREKAKLKLDVIEADQEIVSFLVQAVDAVYIQCDQTLHNSRSAHATHRTADSSVKLDGAMVDKAKLESLQSWMRAQLSGRVAAATVHSKTPSHQNSGNRRSRHNKRSRSKQSVKDARSGQEQNTAQPFVDTSSAVLRASGRHPMQAPLNHDLIGVLSSARIQKPHRGRKKSKSAAAKRQNQLVEDMVEWWKAKGEWEKEKRGKKKQQLTGGQVGKKTN